MNSAMQQQTPPKRPITTKEATYSPVILPQSPAAGSPQNQKNITGLPRVARDIAADIYNNIQKWNDNHLIGCQYVKQIAIAKADAPANFPHGIEAYMKELFNAVQNLSIYSNAFIFLGSQMKALVKLHKQATPLFVSLTAAQLADMTDQISEAYKKEFSAKQYILENIAHSKTKEEVMYFASSWTHQSNITTDIHLKLETILSETGHRKLV